MHLTAVITMLSSVQTGCYSSIRVVLFQSSSDVGWITGPALTPWLEPRSVFTMDGGERIQSTELGQGVMHMGSIQSLWNRQHSLLQNYPH